MAPPYHRKDLKKMQASRSRIIIGHLKKENAFLLKTLHELSNHHSEHNQIIEKFLALVPIRPEVTVPAVRPELSEDRPDAAVSMRRLNCYYREVEELKDQLVRVSARCQYLSSRVTQEQEESAADVEDNDTNVRELQMKLQDAIEKNMQWHVYDQQREAYVRSTLSRMLWLERELREACKSRAVERSDYQSSEKRKIKQVEQYYEGLMQRASEELDVLREQVCLIQTALTAAERECREKQCEVEELRRQLQSDWSVWETLNHPQTPKTEGEPGHTTEDLQGRPGHTTEELQGRLDKERRRSARLELQSGNLQKYFVNHYHKAQEQITKLQRQIEISQKDLEDERENCSYLRQQLLSLQQQTEVKTEKVDSVDSAGPSHLSSLPPPHPSHQRPSLPPVSPLSPLSPHRGLLDQSFMECPHCRTGYPATDYKQLLLHVEDCQQQS